MISTVEINDNTLRTELDSHANMVVEGNDCLVVDWINGKTGVHVLPFDPTIGTSTSIPIASGCCFSI